MRGDTTTENEADDRTAAGATSAERRPSVLTLQNMLKKVSQSPFHNQYQTLVASTSDSSGSSLNGSQNKQDGSFLTATDVTGDHQLHQRQNGGQEMLHLNPQPGVSGDLARMNPFYTNYLESGSRGHVMEDINTIPPPDFQSSPLEFQPEKVKNGADFPKDLFQTVTPNPSHGHFPSQNTSANGYYHDVTLDSADLFKPAQTQTFSKQSNSSDLYKDEGLDRFQAAKAEGNPFDKTPSAFVDPFKSSNKEDDHFWSQDPSTKDDILSKFSFPDVFPSSSTTTANPFASPISRDSFQDPFGATPSKSYDPFQDVGTPDIFKPLPSDGNSRDVFGITSGSTEDKARYSTPSEKKLDVLSELPDLFKANPSEWDDHPTSSDVPQDIFLTTPQGTKHDVIAPSPFSRNRNLHVSPNQSPTEMNHVSTFKRPPKPLPRTRPPRPEKPLKAEKPPKPTSPAEPEAAAPKPAPKPVLRTLPKPVPPYSPASPEGKSLEAEGSPVFEDVLLIGQEKCVEDWPEDSPELNPDFKPAGTFRLRRESMKIKAASEYGSVEDLGGGKKKDKKFRLSLLSRRGSKEKFSEEDKSRTLPTFRKSSKEYYTEENEEVEQSEVNYKKNFLKNKVGQLTRAATFSSSPHGKHMNGHLPQETKGDDFIKKSVSKKESIRRWSEGTVLDGSTGEEEGGEAQHEEKKKKKVKIRFVPQRGFSISLEKGAQGYTPRKNSKDKSQDEFICARGYASRKKSQDDVFEDVEKCNSLPSTSKAAFVDDEPFLKTHHRSAGLNGAEDPFGMEDCKPKKPTNKPLPMGRRSSKEDMLDEMSFQKKKELDNEDWMEDCKPKKPANKPLPMGHRSSKEDMLDEMSFQKKKGSFSAEELDNEDWMEDCKPKKPTNKPNRSSKEDMLDEMSFQKKKGSFSAEELDNEDWMEDCKPKTSKPKVPPPVPRKPKTSFGQSEAAGFSYQTPLQSPSDPFHEDVFNETGKYPDEMYVSDEDELKKPSKQKGFQNQSKTPEPEWEDPPGAASPGFLSEAARAEWLAAQMDERAIAGMEDEDEDGDTDSLMEWWDTVEQWDEVPSDEEDQAMKEDESKSFTVLADKVQRGLRVFNKVFTERAEVLWQSVIMLHAIADNINDFHHKAKIAGITGGTTTAVGGVAAIAGLALAPFTLGASLVITAVGVGVATAGGITSASAAISDNVNNMHDRKKVEIVLQEYEGHLKAIGRILHFVNFGLYKLRGHPFLRSGTQHYSKDWEVRRAVQMISLVDTPVFRGTEVTDTSLASVHGLFKGIDKYFIKDSRELKKGCKKEVVAQIKEVANVLNDGIVELNAIREELQEATGEV